MASPNLRFNELTKYQIYIELIKRFPEMLSKKKGPISLFFGKEWELLDQDAAEKAEELFCEAIENELITGIKIVEETDEIIYQRFSPLNHEQIFIEILKRFPSLEYEEFDNDIGWYSMGYIYGPDWEQLRSKSKEKALDKLIDEILAGDVKGLIYNWDRKKKKVICDDDGNRVFKRVPGDIYQKGSPPKVIRKK